MDVIGVPLLQLMRTIVHIYIWMIIGSVALQWLTMFGVVNHYNRVVATVSDMLFRLTEPVLATIRRMTPHPGGIDLSPIIVILVLYFLENVLGMLIVKMVFAGS